MRLTLKAVKQVRVLRGRAAQLAGVKLLLLQGCTSSDRLRDGHFRQQALVSMLENI